MTDSKKFREWWIFPGETKLTGFPHEHIAMTKPCTPENLIHVIEFSAFESQAKEIAELKDENQKLKKFIITVDEKTGINLTALFKENEQLRETKSVLSAQVLEKQLEIDVLRQYRDANESISSGCTAIYIALRKDITKLRKALEKCKEQRNEFLYFPYLPKDYDEELDEIMGEK